MTVQRLVLDNFPQPSVARTLSPNGRAHHMARHHAIKGVEMHVCVMARMAGLQPMQGLVTLRATWTMPVARRRDQDNYSTGVMKACIDSLVRGGWLEADDSDHLRQEPPVLRVEKGVRRLELELISEGSGR